jgi:hypothetical protein
METFLYKRNIYLHRITPFIGKPVIKIITGMRRVGKSCFLKQLIAHIQHTYGTDPKNILYIDKESLEFEDIRTYRDLDAFIAESFREISGKKYVFIDEVQEITKWEKAIASLAKQGNADIYLTGSNAHLFSSELATLLSGRYIEFPMYSLGFDEFLQFRGDKAASREQEFHHFLRFGGLPAIHHFPLEETIIYQYTSAIYNTILLKDIIARHNVRNAPLLENISRFVFDNIGNIFSAKKIADYLKSQRIRVGVETVQKYLAYFIEALVLYKVPRYDLKGKRLLEVHEKYYLTDPGMRHALLGYREADISGVLENVVFLELKRRGYRVWVGKYDNSEIDFVVTKEREKIYIQVAYLLATPKVVQREFSVLQKIHDNYPKYVLSLDSAFGHDLDGIKRLNIIDFLMQPSLLKA